MPQNFANFWTTTLSSSITATATTCTVGSVSGAPAVPFIIQIDNELMNVTGVAGTTLTIVRAQEGTTGATHAAAAAVAAPVTALGLKNLARPAYLGSATPTGGAAGDIAVGSGVLWVNDNGTWKSLAISGAASAYPNDVAYTSMPTSGGTTPSLPGYLTPVTDGAFATKTTRVTNTSGRRHNYSVLPTWNKDQSQMLMGFQSPYAFLDGTTYAVIRTTTSMPGYPSWSNTDPLKIFGTYSNDNIFYSQHASTDAQSAVHTFTGYTEVSLGDGEGHVDDNDRYVALMTKTSGGANGLLVYDIIANTIVASMTFTTRPDNATISRKGGYVIINWSADGAGAEKGVWKYTRLLTGGVQLETTGGNHGDCGLDAAGNEIYVYINGSIKAYDLATNAATTLLPSGTAFGFGHVSCRNIDRPGYAYLSNYDYVSTASQRGRDMVIAVKTDGSQQVEMFGYQNNHTDGSFYNGQPQACPSRDGKRVAFASVWGTGTTVYEYVVEAV